MVVGRWSPRWEGEVMIGRAAKSLAVWGPKAAPCALQGREGLGMIFLNPNIQSSIWLPGTDGFAV